MTALQASLRERLRKTVSALVLVKDAGCYRFRFVLVSAL